MGAYSALPDSLAGFKEPTSKGREGRKDGRERKGREIWEERVGKGVGKEGNREERKGGERKRWDSRGKKGNLPLLENIMQAPLRVTAPS